MKTGGMRHFVRRASAFGRTIARETGGVSAIEFAIASPFVFILVIGTVEMASEMMIDATVQMAAQAASRIGLINVAPADGTTREAAAQAAAMKVLGNWATMANTTVTITEVDYRTYAAVSAGPASSATGAGGFGDVVSYNITLKTKGISGLPGLFGVEWLTFTRNFLVQNEK